MLQKTRAGLPELAFRIRYILTLIAVFQEWLSCYTRIFMATVIIAWKCDTGTSVVLSLVCVLHVETAKRWMNRALKTQENKRLRGLRRREDIERGAETNGRAKSGTAENPPISGLSVVPLITSLSADGERLFWRRSSLRQRWWHCSVPRGSLNRCWRADQHHADLMFPFEWERGNNQSEVARRCSMLLYLYVKLARHYWEEILL